MKPMRFVHAGSPEREPLHYTACGLPNVYLTSGYQAREVNGERYVSVHDVEDLHQAIALYLTTQKKELTGAEVRFIRKYLDLTQRELGNFLGVSDQSVARYEKGKSALEGAEDMVLRLLVQNQVKGCLDVREVIERLHEADDAPAGALTFELDDHDWKVAA